MDHVYISLTEYLWVSWVLRPSAIITTLFGGMIQRGLLGIAILRIKERLGLIKINSDQKAEEKLYNLIMETTLVTWLRLDKGEDDSLLGVFNVPGTFHAFPGGKHWKSSRLYIEINISRRRVLKTFYDNQSISYPDAVSLTFLALVGMTHPVIHSYANWGVNPDISNGFLRRMALCTLKYNSMGVNQFRTATASFKRLGLFKHITPKMLELVNHHGSYTVPKHNHQNWLMLRQQSEFVRFILDLRGVFMGEFAKHKQDFVGIDQEALFLGTVVHSVDHLQAGYGYNNSISFCCLF